jgi:hypothetical protein
LGAALALNADYTLVAAMLDAEKIAEIGSPIIRVDEVAVIHALQRIPQSAKGLVRSSFANLKIDATAGDIVMEWTRLVQKFFRVFFKVRGEVQKNMRMQTFAP